MKRSLKYTELQLRQDRLQSAIDDVLYKLDNGELEPSDELTDAVAHMLTEIDDIAQELAELRSPAAFIAAEDVMAMWAAKSGGCHVC